MKFENAYALVIGIAGYDRIRKLPYTKDAQDIAALLRDPELCGYSHVDQLLESQATGPEILKALDHLAEVPEGSTVLIYFSGHGASLGGAEVRGEYLLPFEATYPDEAELARTAIASRTFTEKVAAIRRRAKHLTVILDCCHAGGIFEQESKDLVPESIQPGLSDDYVTSLKDGQGSPRAEQGCAIFAATSADKPAFVKFGAEHGDYTQVLLNGLRGGAKGSRGVIRLGNMMTYITEAMAKVNQNQVPVFKLDGPDYPIANYLGASSGSGEVVRGGFEALLRLARAPEVKAVVAEIRDRLGSTRARISTVLGLKRMHDRLHEIQLVQYTSIVDNRALLPAREAATQVARMARQVVQAVNPLRIDAARAYPSSAPLAWIDELEEGARLVAVSVLGDSIDQVDQGIWNINEVLGKIPSEINADLRAQIRSMNLRELFLALRKVEDHLIRLQLAPEDTRKFAEGGRDLGRLDRDLEELMAQHDKWQKVDNFVCGIKIRRKGNAREVTSTWPSLAKMLGGLVERIPDTQTREVISKWVAELGSALESKADEGVRDEAFLNLFYDVRTWFHDLDRLLLEHCGELALIDAVLGTVVDLVMESDS